ncbi:non-ribosomal peptide synthetase, partial [Bacillus mycoides]|uniref:non-ribosomal peptide synthetase n=1 Tax=Bacillus mycoides TaxID=1405 RepID=UPI0018CF5630
EYNTDLFDDETISRMWQHYITLLESVVNNPEQSISQLPMLTMEEKKQALLNWNNTNVEYPRERCIQDLFEEQVRQNPDAIALRYLEQSMTYSQLNQQANQLAHYLKKQGVTPQTMVGLCVERSMDMIIGILGILKVGGIYVPLDASYPEERLRFMIEDAKISVLVTQSHMKEVFPCDGMTTVMVDHDWKKISQESLENPRNELTGEHIAYVNYTSGSTGKPKGVVIPHRGVLRLVKENNYVRLTSKEILLQFAPVSFDAATFEIWGSLLNGAQLVIYPYGQASLEELGQVLRQNKVSTLWLTAGLFHQMVEYRLEDLKGVRQILAGGDVLSPVHVRKVLEELDDCLLINGYGPTENTTFTCCYPMSDVSQVRHTVPIGRPIANTQVYVLDQQLQPVPIGIPGELYIGGDGLALEYLNQPALTKEKFIPHLFSDDQEAQLYKTGDLVRYLPDGNIEFLGRTDNQVKIRGFRIELGEIEVVLEQYPHVQKAVVVIQETASGDRRLIAYIVMDKEHEFLVKDLRNYIKENLPEYLIPAIFVTIESLPLSPNGKVNRAALPAPEVSGSDLIEFTPPRNSTEEAIAEIWMQLLQVDQIGIHDNFFELGGHSLVATQVISRLHEALGVRLSVRSIFSHSTVAELATYIEDIHNGNQDVSEKIISPVVRGACLPLSFAQQRLWFVDKWQSDTVHLYNIPIAYRIQGILDYEALNFSLSEIIRRHESLRTIFKEIEGQPIQVINSNVKANVNLVNLSAEPEYEREQLAKSIMIEEAHHAFDLSQGPLFRPTLIKLAMEQYILMLNFHHIISDGWSNGIFMKELSDLYESFIAGRPSPLVDLKFQYADYAVEQRQWLEGERLEESLAYWKKQLGGKLPVLQLPSDRPRPAVQTFRGKTKKFKIPNELLKKVKVLSQEERSSLFMTLLTGFKVLLYRYTGQEDLLVGTPVANRNQKALENLIGFFVNTLVVRTDVSGDVSFRDLLRRVREVTLEAYAHQDVPFEKLVEELQPDRDVSTSPLFQVMFTLQNAPLISTTLAGSTLESIEMAYDIAKFDLTMAVTEMEDELQGVFEYNEDLFNESTISRMAESFCTLLEGIVTNPEESIKKLPIMSSEEQRKSLVDWNDTTKGYPLEKGMHQFFEDRVVQHPEAIAAVFEGESITYQELNRRANQLAHHLKLVGVESQAFIGIYMERSLEMLITLLAVFKAEGVYVPLDPSYPKDRITFMLEDSQTSVILTQRQLVSKLPNHDVKVICADADWDQVRQCSDSNLPRCGDKDSLAYTIYTSGSTGKPKGVQITNDALINCLLATNEHIQLNEQDRFLAVATISFDIACVELYLPLILGACVVIAKREVSTDGECLAELINTSGATIMQATPATWQMLIQAGWNGNLQLKVLTGGEALPLKLANDLIDRSAGVWNGYGPTEATIYTTISKVTTEDSWISIGRPIANTSIYVLDDQLQPVPVGVPGELHIGGSGLAAGYLNRPELTAERFIQDPFSNKPNARMYKTGDLVRYRSNGELEFISRIDHQVKVRGFRIELGEIENVLIKDVNIKEVVVIVHEDVLGEKRLVAYVVPNEKQSLNTKSLRSLLKGNLPDYMIPSAFIVMDKFPLTLNGKIDRQALPMPEKFESMRDKDFVAPRNRTEELLADIWCTVLQVDKVGIDDNFFEMGGHSLLATQVLWQLR